MHEKNLPQKLDVKQFGRSESTLVGQELLSNFKRLMQETQGLGGENAVEWSVRGGFKPSQAGQAQVWLFLTVEVVLPLVCQRCMGPVNVPIQIDRAFRFVETEAQAELEDDESQEDVLVLSQDFDLAGLIEDEVLMDLPVVPRHDVCPVEIKLSATDASFESEVKKPNPFSVLADLKGRSQT